MAMTAATIAAPTSPAAFSQDRFLSEKPQTGLFFTDGRVTQVYGKAFSQGATPQASAEAFLSDYAQMFGVSVEELAPGGPQAGGAHVQPIMYNAQTGQYKFTGLFYTQQRDGIPVFRSRLTLLVRNEMGYPLVLASSSLNDLGDFNAQVGPRILNAGRGITNA